jgi:hypothetical protein
VLTNLFGSRGGCGASVGIGIYTGSARRCEDLAAVSFSCEGVECAWVSVFLSRRCSAEVVSSRYRTNDIYFYTTSTTKDRANHLLHPLPRLLLPPDTATVVGR